MLVLPLNDCYMLLSWVVESKYGLISVETFG
jgi:hypothetical protein